MILVYLTSRIVSCLVAFLYPGYASFKTLSQRPASEQDLERWLMYWSVLACVVGLEYLAEWLISWIPFYYLFKMLFLLYLALPQTQGASYLYLTHLEPTLRAHEQQIDAALAQLRARAFSFLQARARMLWDSIVASASTPQPAPHDSVSGPTQLLGTLWRTYGPAIVAGGTALLQRQGVAPNAAPATETPRGYDLSDGPEPVPMPHMKHRTSSSGSFTGLRERVGSSSNVGPGGRFEEIEVPSDAEGERSADSTPAARSSGWFGWVTAAPAHTKTE
ncbi:TB2/DP1, HVA22 family-domain-containing protein [Lactifluus volemus]|nr:TB2/DP1, HVA22 family-domain-containing protein [Lactifluus volemus]